MMRGAISRKSDPIRAAMTSEVVQQLGASGVLIGTGTDGSPETCAIPGLILHDELKELKDSGLTVPQVLDAATRISAKIAGAEKSGRVAEGYFADLVLTRSDPLRSLGALDAITAVVAAGAFLGAEDLDALRARAQLASGQ
jgi:imidazolonepropionase-like amidohydrolase